MSVERVAVATAPRLSGVPMSGRRVRLERLARSHMAALHTIVSDEAVATGWPLLGRDVPLDDFEDHIWRVAELQYAIVRRDSGVTIGVVQGVSPSRRNGTIGLGMTIAPDLWRVGWPLEAAVLFMHLVFCGEGYRKIYCSVPIDVLARIRGLGTMMTTECTYRDHVRLNGGYQDLVILSLTRDKWNAELALRITGNA